MLPSDTDHAIPVAEPGSYRDFSARVFYAGRRVFRGLKPSAIPAWREVEQTRFYQAGLLDGTIVGTRELSAAERAELAEAYPSSDATRDAPFRTWPVVLEHQRLPFVSYPYEWSFGMLQDAALLHLDLLAAALSEGFVIKDGTAYNVQFSGVRPVFVDVTSFQRYRPGEPWAGYRQFCQMFLYPLMLQAYRNVAFQPWLRGHLDGVTPGEFRKLLSWRDCFRRGVLHHVLLHSMLQSGVTESSQNTQMRLNRSGLNAGIILATVDHLRKTIAGLKWKAESVWTGYADDNAYPAAEREQKAAFVRHAANQIKPRRVWDLGGNTGEYSRICAASSAAVITLDADAACIDRLFSSLKREGPSNVLPLVWNIVNSSPNMGWRGLERKGLAERGRPHLTLCLALLHHLALTASVPLDQILAWFRSLGTALVIEFVDRQDPMAARLLAGRPDDCADYRQDVFERLLEQNFQVQQKLPLGSGTRTLYFATARSDGS